MLLYIWWCCIDDDPLTMMVVVWQAWTRITTARLWASRSFRTAAMRKTGITCNRSTWCARRWTTANPTASSTLPRRRWIGRPKPFRKSSSRACSPPKEPSRNSSSTSSAPSSPWTSTCRRPSNGSLISSMKAPANTTSAIPKSSTLGNPTGQYLTSSPSIHLKNPSIHPSV